MSRPIQMCILLLLCSVFAAAPFAAESTTDENRQVELDTKIANLIEQLASEEFAVREKAKNDLARIGLAAFDALDEAEKHRDFEVARQAHYLLRSFDVVWSLDTDSPEVKSILKGYGHRMEPDERRARIERLGRLENRQGWDALGRIARFETDKPLARLAAFLIMQSPPPTGDEIEKAANQLQRSAAQSRRASSQWLRTYARTLREPETVHAEWDRLIGDEFERISSASPDEVDRYVTVQLARWHVESLLKTNDKENSLRWAGRLTSFAELERRGAGKYDYLPEHIDWLTTKQLWSPVLEAASVYPKEFSDSPRLLYGKALAQLKTGEKDAADATSREALAINPDNAAAHDEMGEWLAKRGQFAWAEKEYRHVMDSNPLDSIFSFRCRSKLSEMFHDQAQEAAAGEVLRPVVEELDRNPAFGDRIPRDEGGLRARMQYFFGMNEVQKGNFAKARELFELGIKADAEDADVLIALYRLPEQNESQKKQVRELIDAAAASMREQIDDDAQQLAQNEFQYLATAKHRLALAHNQYAWLVSNTVGDYQSALQSSKESLRLRPEQPEYQDTLGRCYYAVGDLENAIKSQRQAVKAEPFSGQMQRQLDFFLKEAKKSAQ